jgi:hypothetical protein
MNVPDRLRAHKFKIGVAALAALGAFLVFQLDYHPAAIVNGYSISARSFRKNLNFASIYYANLKQVYALEDSVVLSGPSFRAAILDRLVESTLARQEAERIVGADLDGLVEGKVSRYRDDEKIREAAEALYGMTAAEFSRWVLVPQAERDVLTGRLFLEGKTLEDVLRGARRSARVIIFSEGLRWDGERVVAE